ncbi:MAG: recombinase family protein [Desulfovibrionaceae bacterium]|nr:recombinase family protein [Desulfovibrionaceae bacterium]
MLYGYIRTTDAQTNEVGSFLKSCPVAEEALFVDSGKNSDRAELARLLSRVVDGDEVYIQDISHLGRNAQEYRETLASLTDRGVAVLIHTSRLRFGPHRDREKSRKSFSNIIHSLKRLENTLENTQ